MYGRVYIKDHKDLTWVKGDMRRGIFSVSVTTVDLGTYRIPRRSIVCIQECTVAQGAR